MHDPKIKAAMRWYFAGVCLSILALIFAVISQFSPRLGYPLAFVFTMAGVLAITEPAWERKERRLRLAMTQSTILVTQVAILYFGMAGAAA